MPLFDFKCKTCGQTDERLAHRNQASTSCLRCGEPTERLPNSQFAFSLKGAGVYKPGVSMPTRKQS